MLDSSRSRSNPHSGELKGLLEAVMVPQSIFLHEQDHEHSLEIEPGWICCLFGSGMTFLHMPGTPSRAKEAEAQKKETFVDLTPLQPVTSEIDLKLSQYRKEMPNLQQMVKELASKQ